MEGRRSGELKLLVSTRQSNPRKRSGEMLGTEDFGAGGTVRGFDSFTWGRNLLRTDSEGRSACCCGWPAWSQGRRRHSSSLTWSHRVPCPRGYIAARLKGYARSRAPSRAFRAVYRVMRSCQSDPSRSLIRRLARGVQRFVRGVDAARPRSVAPADRLRLGHRRLVQSRQPSTLSGSARRTRRRQAAAPRAGAEPPALVRL